MSATLREILSKTISRLRQAGIDDAAREARLLMSAALDIASDRLVLRLDERPEPDMQMRLDALVARRSAREPLSHLTGARAFYDHVFAVSPDVLDPRPETECLVRAALERPFSHILDLGTGSGCILLSLLAARPEASGLGTDLSARALKIAARNAEALQIGLRVMFVQSDWFEAVEGRFDLITCNPPYISATEMTSLAPELAYEPRFALTDESDGLSVYRRLIPQARDFLTPQGRILVEIGHQQAAEVKQIFDRAGYRSIQTRPDLDGRDRVVEATLG